MFLRCLACLWFLLAWPAFGQAPPPVMVAGHKVIVQVDQNAGVANIFVDGKNIGGDMAALNPKLYGPYKFADLSLLGVEFFSGGTGCPAMFKALIFTKTVALTPEFGNCGDQPTVTRHADSILFSFGTMQDGNGSDDFRLDATGLHETIIPNKLAGPAFRPGMNLAAMLLGHHTVDVFTLRAPAEAIRQLIGADLYQTLLSGELEFKFLPIGDYLIGDLGGPQLPTFDKVHLAFDTHGHVWVGTEAFNDKTDKADVKWYGNPPAAVIAAAAAYETIPVN